MTVLVIRNEQIEALRKSALQQFSEENAQRVRLRFADAVSDGTEDDVLERVVRAMHRARQHGITRKCDIEQFIDLEFLYGPEFERRHAEPGQILNRKQIDGSRKMALIEDWELFSRPPRSHN
jgi:hypothetical protein